MADSKCGNCSLRAKFDNNPKSFLGRIWKWHIKWCPGWKSYITSFPDDEKEKVLAKYSKRKAQFEFEELIMAIMLTAYFSDDSKKSFDCENDKDSMMRRNDLLESGYHDKGYQEEKYD